MAAKIQVGDQWYVSATSARAESSPRVLKENETFVLFDRFGDVQVLRIGDEGLYHEDTRFLSHLELLVDGARPLYLGSTVKENNGLLVIELMNPDVTLDGVVRVAKGTVHIVRAKFLWEEACYERIRLTNHGLEPVEVRISLGFDADFVDLFEVRGMTRERHGRRLPTHVGSDEVELRYVGADERFRSTVLHFDPRPTSLTDRDAEFRVRLPTGSEAYLHCTITCRTRSPGLGPMTTYGEALERNGEARSRSAAERCQVLTSNPLFNMWIDRSISDLLMLTTALPTGPYPYAGVPWYSTTFGRDGLITARECLWVDPSLARGVLAFLADTQSTGFAPERDAEPGKIIHEARRGEMARTGEIPFGCYYGTVDATPLFVSLLGAYYRRTGDLDFVRYLWPNVAAALEWIDRHGDLDGDGFVEYARRSPRGLVQQGWKDSHDSVFHADGTLAEGPIALCEVQGYVYEAKSEAAYLARRLGHEALAARLEHETRTLKRRFAEAFWCDSIGTYALALDGEKRQCEVPSSNAGHTLWSGIARTEHAAKVVTSLMGDAFFSGWGVRTIPEHGRRYNPMSYHNGSIWPHDNALIAAGMARYGFVKEASRILASLFEASIHLDSHRLPELFCGFARRSSEGPTLYPVACSPQAWAAAAVFGMLEACLGISFDAEQPSISFQSPALPSFVDWVTLHRLSLGKHSVDLALQRYHHNVGVEMLRREGDVAVLVSM